MYYGQCVLIGRMRGEESQCSLLMRTDTPVIGRKGKSRKMIKVEKAGIDPAASSLLTKRSTI